MANLLSLPQELLDEVIAAALCDERTPRSDEIAADGVLQKVSQENSRSARVPTTADTKIFRCHATPLMLTCRSLHATTLSAISRLVTRKPKSLIESTAATTSQRRNFSVDLLTVNEQAYVPTWTNLSTLSSEIDTLEIKLRHHGSAFERNLDTDGWTAGDFPPMLARLADFVRNILLVGPGLGQADGVDYARQYQQKDISVKTLRLDLITPAAVTPAPGWAEKREDLSRSSRPVWRDDGMVDVEVIIRIINGFFEWFFRHVRFECSESTFTRLLYERVGNLEVCLDGQVRKTYSFAVMLDWLEIRAQPGYRLDWLKDQKALLKDEMMLRRVTAGV